MSQLQITNRPIDVLIPYARNSRTHSDAQVAQIAGSIREFGWTNPVLVDGENGIIAGHGRVLAARKLGMSEVPVIELAHMTESQKRAYVIADNKLAEQAGWDTELLALELGELKADGFDLELTGFDAGDIDELLDLEVDGGNSRIEPDEAVKALIDEAWIGVTKEWTAHIERAQAGGLLSPQVTPSIAAFTYLEPTKATVQTGLSGL